MRELRQFKLIILKEDKIAKILTLKNYYDTKTGLFDFASMKKQLYTNPKLNKVNFVTYGQDYRVISAVVNNTLYDFQGYKDWAVVKKYLEKDSQGRAIVNTKKLIRRYKDIERAFQRELKKGRENGRNR